jgi:hypothetical protein
MSINGKAFNVHTKYRMSRKSSITVENIKCKEAIWTDIESNNVIILPNYELTLWS